MYELGVFEELGDAIDGLDIPANNAALAALMAMRDRLDARISDAVAACDRAGVWELDGAASMTSWLTDRAAMPCPPGRRRHPRNHQPRQPHPHQPPTPG